MLLKKFNSLSHIFSKKKVQFFESITALACETRHFVAVQKNLQFVGRSPVGLVRLQGRAGRTARQTVQELGSGLALVEQGRIKGSASASGALWTGAACILPVLVVVAVGREGLIDAVSQWIIHRTKPCQTAIRVGSWWRLDAGETLDVRRGRDPAEAEWCDPVRESEAGDLQEANAAMW